MDTDAGRSVHAEDRSRQWSRLALATGVTGLLAVPILFSAIIAVSSVGEPPLDAPSGDTAAFFRALGAERVQAAEALASVGMLVFLWFVVGFALRLRRAEGDPPWRAGVAFASGLLLAAYGVLDASWDVPAHRGDELTTRWPVTRSTSGTSGSPMPGALASFALAAGWVVVTTGFLPVWTGWLAIIGGAGLVVVRFLWQVDGLWFLPYGLVWLWVIATCVSLVRRRATLGNGGGVGS